MTNTVITYQEPSGRVKEKVFWNGEYESNRDFIDAVDWCVESLSDSGCTILSIENEKF